MSYIDLDYRTVEKMEQLRDLLGAAWSDNIARDDEKSMLRLLENILDNDTDELQEKIDYLKERLGE